MLFKRLFAKTNPQPLPGTEVKKGNVITIEECGRLRFKVRSITKGGMGVVYELQPIDSRYSTKAAKTFLDGANVQVFEKEAENWFLIGEHPYVAKATWFGNWNNRLCILMDWYDRKLSDLDVRQLRVDSIIDTVISIMDGLNYGFSRVGLIHQDIKPSNILIDKNGKPRIADFGISLVSGSTITLSGYSSIKTHGKGTISTGAIGGTPFYMAPELLLGQAKPSVQTDIYSLGVTIYEWLTREHPFLGPETGFEFRPILREFPLQQVRGSLGTHVDPVIDFIKSSLRLEPASRPRSYSEIALFSSRSTPRHAPTQYEMAHEIQKLVLVYRNQGQFERAKHLCNSGLRLYKDDALLLNTRARLSLMTNDLEDAERCFKEGFLSLQKTNGLYADKPYLDPAMNYAKLLIVAQEFDNAEDVLGVCWDWADGGKDERFLEYEELAWYLLSIGNPQNAADILLHISESRSLGNHALRWYTLSLFWCDMLRVLAPRVSAAWLNADLKYDTVDAMAMALCAMFTPPPLRDRIWSIVDTFESTFADAASMHNLKADWYKFSYQDYPKLLAGLLDILTTGGVYSEQYSSLAVERI